MTKRINKVIELLEQNQPVYYTTAKDVSYEGGKELAKTFAGVVQYLLKERNHGVFLAALGLMSEILTVKPKLKKKFKITPHLITLLII